MLPISNKPMNAYKIVAAMNTAFGNPAGDYNDINWPKVIKQCSNIKSEINEMKKAYAEKDIYQFRDAACDISVFAYGAYHFMGYDLSAPIQSFPVISSNIQDIINSVEREMGSLDSDYSDIMESANSNNPQDLVGSLYGVISRAALIQSYLQVSHQVDMQSVIDGVMTRFIKDDADKAATIAKHAALGVTDVYFEGNYPEMIMKSASDQPDAPKGKFLKSASFTEPVFTEYTGPAIFGEDLQIVNG